MATNTRSNLRSIIASLEAVIERARLLDGQYQTQARQRATERDALAGNRASSGMAWAAHDLAKRRATSAEGLAEAHRRKLRALERRMRALREELDALPPE